MNELRIFVTFDVQEIGVEDLKLAVKLSDVRVTGVDPRDQIIKTVREKINRKDLVALVDKDNASIRYPKNMLLQRNHTFVPGHEAYDEVCCMKSVVSTKRC